MCDAGDVIPSDGEIIEGLASIDETSLFNRYLYPSNKLIESREVILGSDLIFLIFV